MASRVCPACGALNSADDQTCYRCKRRLPGKAGSFFSELTAQNALFTRGTVLLCLVVFGLMVTVDGRLPLAPELGMGRPFRTYTLVRFGALLHVPGVPLEWWRLLSAVFVHASVLHLALNMWVLLRFGSMIEERFGAARAALVLVLTGVFGFVVSTVWGVPFTLGASGGIFGLLGAEIGILIIRKYPNWKAVLGERLLSALILALIMRVNTPAHIGGLAAGVALGMLFEAERRRPLVTSFLGVLAGLCALAAVASVGLSTISPLTKAVAREVIEE